MGLHNWRGQPTSRIQEKTPQISDAFLYAIVESFLLDLFNFLDGATNLEQLRITCAEILIRSRDVGY
jgi:hypothetical protein